MRRAGFVLLSVLACTPPTSTPARPASSSPVMASDAGSPHADLPSFDAIVRRAGSVVSGMRESLRADGTTTIVAHVDTCFRAYVVGEGSIRAWFEEPGRLRGEVSLGGTVPPRGPACFRSGEQVRLVVDGAPARAVAWEDP